MKRMLKNIIQGKPSNNTYQSCDEFWEGSELPLCCKEFPVIVSWSPKSGCTTILKWFLEQNNLLEEANKFSHWVHDYRENKLCFGTDYKELCMRYFKENPSTKHIIKLIRDPYKRAVSSYLHVLRWGLLTEDWAVIAKIENWKKSNGIAYQKGMSFRQFLLFIIDQRARGIVLDPHLKQQYDKTQDPKVNQFVRIENFSTEIELIEKRFSLVCSDKNRISTSIHHNKASISHCWPSDASSYVANHDYESNLGTPPAEIFLDNETRVLVKIAYWRDCDAYAEHYEHM